MARCTTIRVFGARRRWRLFSDRPPGNRPLLSLALSLTIEKPNKPYVVSFYAWTGKKSTKSLRTLPFSRYTTFIALPKTASREEMGNDYGNHPSTCRRCSTYSFPEHSGRRVLQIYVIYARVIYVSFGWSFTRSARTYYLLALGIFPSVRFRVLRTDPYGIFFTPPGVIIRKP